MRLDTVSMAIAGLILATAAPAADFADPAWPCVQRKVERLSVGLMWPDPPLSAPEMSDDTAAAVDDLVARLSLRRIPVEDLPPRVEAFTKAHGTDRTLLGHVFAQVFDRLARTRSEVMTGIEDYSLDQIALSRRIDAARGEMDTQMAQDAPDFDRVDALEEQIDWDQRIYTDRQRSLTYVCETPVLLEKRLYAIAQMLAAVAE
ncbi:hypothetical protein [uncultured Jannaschia sp.]|uniref:hypothetical protein n=1 Tax=uncultured Jannaschia sp. TaxID=293347 RepID=UPI0026392A0D|nr:hypothetical protein [uncultured Jannaschia sp.]